MHHTGTLQTKVCSILSAILLSQFRPSVTLEIHAQAIQNMEMWFTPRDVLMLENCCGTEYDVMVPYSLNQVLRRNGTQNELNLGKGTMTSHDWVQTRAP